MRKQPKLIYLVADGAKARLVARSPETGDYHTLRELDGSEPLAEARVRVRGAAQGRSFESSGRARHAVGRDEAIYQRVKAAFAAKAAQALQEETANGGWDGVVLVASERLLPQLRRRLKPCVAVRGEVAKDLTKVPDHALAEWLDALPLIGPEAAPH